MDVESGMGLTSRKKSTAKGSDTRRKSRSESPGPGMSNGNSRIKHSSRSRSHCRERSPAPQIAAAPPSSYESESKINWWYEDRSSVLLLLFFYILQGIPLGLAGSIPMLLAARKLDYQEQALFSFVFWPFSLKLLWAPIVDGAYSTRLGRRKTWLVPTQYVISIVMYVLSQRLDDMLGAGVPDLASLTICFFVLNFCAATQDIAVDGWALTMLSKKNVGLASTCNSVGQTAGYFLGYVLFLALESAEFCNQYIRSVPAPEGIVTLASFMHFWSIVFCVTTTLVMLLKTETNEGDEDDDFTAQRGVVSTYKLLWKILTMPQVAQYVVILLTAKVGFAAEAIVALKLVEVGIHKESLALLAVPLTPLQIFLPLLIAKYTSGPQPMNVFLKAMKYRLLFNLIFPLVVYLTPYWKREDGSYPFEYFGMILIVYCLHQVTLYSMFVSLMAFNAKISDPRIGGTYMTLLNTVGNLGGNWPTTLALYFTDTLTWGYCVNGPTDLQYCTKHTKAACIAGGGTCYVVLDGFYVISAVCFILGIIWIWRKASLTRQLQDLDLESWRCQMY